MCCVLIIYYKLLQNYFDQMLTFNHLSFHQFVQEVNETEYLRSLIMALLGYHISLTACTKCWNGKRLNFSLWSKLFCVKSVSFQKWYRSCYTYHFKVYCFIVSLNAKVLVFNFHSDDLRPFEVYCRLTITVFDKDTNETSSYPYPSTTEFLKNRMKTLIIKRCLKLYDVKEEK